MSPEEPTCPHCARPLLVGEVGSDCPFCHQALAAPANPPPVVLNAGKTNWPLFFVIFFTPAIGNFISVAFNSLIFPILFTLVGGICSAIVCSRMIMARVQAAGMKRQFLSLVILLGLFALTFFLSFLGCASGAGILHGRF